MKVSPTQGEAPHACPPTVVVAAAAIHYHITHYCLTILQLQQPSMIPEQRQKGDIQLETIRESRVHPMKKKIIN